MGYAQYLRDLLRPLGVYKLDETSFSGAELEALGSEMDKLWQHMQAMQLESIVMTAQDEGLTNWERVFPKRSAAATTEGRRAAIAAYSQVSGDSFTKQALDRCLTASGVECQVEQTGSGLSVSFPGLMGEPEDLAKIQQIVELLLPCHLLTTYVFVYCTWGTLLDNHVTWGYFEGKTWVDMMSYQPGG